MSMQLRCSHGSLNCQQDPVGFRSASIEAECHVLNIQAKAFIRTALDRPSLNAWYLQTKLSKLIAGLMGCGPLTRVSFL